MAASLGVGGGNGELDGVGDGCGDGCDCVELALLCKIIRPYPRNREHHERSDYDAVTDGAELYQSLRVLCDKITKHPQKPRA